MPSFARVVSEAQSAAQARPPTRPVVAVARPGTAALTAPGATPVGAGSVDPEQLSWDVSSYAPTPHESSAAAGGGGGVHGARPSSSGAFHDEGRAQRAASQHQEYVTTCLSVWLCGCWRLTALLAWVAVQVRQGDCGRVRRRRATGGRACLHVVFDLERGARVSRLVRRAGRQGVVRSAGCCPPGARGGARAAKEGEGEDKREGEGEGRHQAAAARGDHQTAPPSGAAQALGCLALTLTLGVAFAVAITRWLAAVGGVAARVRRVSTPPARASAQGSSRAPAKRPSASPCDAAVV